MTKQLITLIGALITAVVLIAAVMVGVVPLVGGVFSADAQRSQVAATNQSYEMQIAALQVQQKRMGEIEAAVAQLRAQVPDAPLLNQVFERISRSEDSSGVRVVAVTSSEAVPYAARTGMGEDAPTAATPPPATTTETGTPIDGANDVAADANANASATEAGTGAADAPAQTPAPVASARAQVEISIRITAPDMVSAFAFLDGLRTGPRAIAVDSTTATQTPDGFDVQITAVAFVHTPAPAATTPGAP